MVATLSLVVATLLLSNLNRQLDETNTDLEAAFEREKSEKQQAEDNAKTAKERLAETRAVLDFVEDKIFAAARPEDQESGLGHDVTLRKAVKAALPFVDKSFTKQPLIEARLRTTLATSFGYLGDAETAAEHRGAGIG